MAKVITVVEAVVAPEARARLVQEYNALTDMPAGLIQSFLQQSASDPNVWQVISIWENMDALEKMRATSDTPAAIAVFQKVGAMPVVKIFTILVEKK